MSWLQIVIYVLIALYFLTVASVVFNVILENRNPVRTLAWIIVLITVPLIGFVFYLYFGVNYRKIKMFSMKGLGDMKWLQYMSEDQKQLIKKSEFLKKRESAEVRKLMTLLLNNSKALLTRYNRGGNFSGSIRCFGAGTKIYSSGILYHCRRAFGYTIERNFASQGERRGGGPDYIR